MTHIPPPDLEKIIKRLTASTRSPRAEYTAEKGYPLLKRRIQRRRFRVYLQTSAAIAAILTAGVMGWSIYQHAQPIEMHTVRTLAETREVWLPDGSQVTLNRYSSVTYPEVFHSGTRRVSLEGEAFFKVTSNKKLPFQVITQEIQIEVLGTEFNVEAYSMDEYIKTTLFQGAVAVSHPDSDQQLILAPHEYALYRKSDQYLIQEKTEWSDAEEAWLQGELLFRETPLGEILRKLSNYHHLRITLTDPDISDYQISGRFSTSDPPEKILSLLQEIVPFEYTIQPNEIH